MSTATIDPATIQGLLHRLLEGTREFQADELLYTGVSLRLRVGASAILWLYSNGRATITEPEFTECPSFFGDAHLASATLALLCAIGAFTWQPGDTDEFGEILYHINLD